MSPTNLILRRHLIHLLVVGLAGTGAAVVQATHEVPFIGQQFLNEGQNSEPYGLPSQKLAEIFAKAPSIEAKYPIQGYNIFAPGPRDESAPEAVPGWQIQIKLTTDISLDGVDLSFLDGVSPDIVEDDIDEIEGEDGGEDWCEDEKEVFDTVLISLVPPASLVSTEPRFSFNNNSGNNTARVHNWTVCAAVWVTGLIMDNTTGSKSSTFASFSSLQRHFNASSSCLGLVSDQCISDMITEFNSAHGGDCKSRTLPRSCRAAFSNGDDELAAVNLAQTLTGASNDIFPFGTPIFAASTYPRMAEEKPTAEALKAVNEWVFPIVMSWTSPEGGPTQSHLSCVGINRALGATSPLATPSDLPRPAVLVSGASSIHWVSAYGVLALVGGALSLQEVW
ncbi:hypothetical protein V8F20_001481 [Naviculisporaceae sp. PSN 640]